MVFQKKNLILFYLALIITSSPSLVAYQIDYYYTPKKNFSTEDELFHVITVYTSLISNISGFLGGILSNTDDSTDSGFEKVISNAKTDVAVITPFAIVGTLAGAWANRIIENNPLDDVMLKIKSNKEIFFFTVIGTHVAGYTTGYLIKKSCKNLIKTITSFFKK